ncbi:MULTISPECIES: type II toxin-antitoxin system RelE/ParE family toxin [unclassified Roseitalea]|uniref:type II toxin-antitoxin system RelE/ParE family toxin n=1 Tax=unclassified Roseitalea TaxID=2639107 RepID=UPI00273FC70A|nr:MULTISPECIES: type II toxin-antitoxin system RelE/ParE family toxin [unclassified Roseitalea]
MFVLKEYETALGRSPFADWFDELDATAALRVRRVLVRIESGNLGDVKSVGDGVFERRVDHGPGYRVYFGRDGRELIILLVGGTKRRQQRDIENAKWMWADYKARKDKA